MLIIRRHILLALASMGLIVLVSSNSYALSPPVTKLKKKKTKSKKRKKAKKKKTKKKAKEKKAKRKTAI